MRTEKQRIIKQVLCKSFFSESCYLPPPKTSHMSIVCLSLASVQAVEELQALQHHLWGQKTAFLALYLLPNTETHVNLPVWCFSAQQGAKLWISLLFSVKRKRKIRGKMAEKTESKYLGKESHEAVFFCFLKKKTQRKLLLFRKTREYKSIEKFSIAGIKSLQSLQNDKVIKTEAGI